MAFGAGKLISYYLGGSELRILGNSRLVLRKFKQLLSNFEAERWENLSNLRLAKKSVAYKKNSSVLAQFKIMLKGTNLDMFNLRIWSQNDISLK